MLGNWLAAEGLAEAAALRGLRRPRVPHKVIEPVADDLLRRLLAICTVRDRAIVLLMIDTGLRVSEVAALRLGDLRADGSLKVSGKGSKERTTPVGSTARQAIVRYLGQRGPGAPTTLDGSVERARSAPAVSSTWSAGSRPGRGRSDGSARTRSATPSPQATSSTAVMTSLSSGSSATRVSTWSSATSRWLMQTSRRGTPWPHQPIVCSAASLGSSGGNCAQERDSLDGAH